MRIKLFGWGVTLVMLSGVLLAFLPKFWVESRAEYGYTADRAWSTHAATNYDEKEHPCVIFGDSRSLALSPATIYEKTGIQCLNLSVATGELLTAYTHFLQVLERGTPTHVYFALSHNEGMIFFEHERPKQVVYAKYSLRKNQLKHIRPFLPIIDEVWKSSRFLAKEYFTKDIKKQWKKAKDFQKFNAKIQKDTREAHDGMRLVTAIIEPDKVIEKNGEVVTDYSLLTGFAENQTKQGMVRKMGMSKAVLAEIMATIKEKKIENVGFFASPIADLGYENKEEALGTLLELAEEIPRQNLIPTLILPKEDFLKHSHLNYPGAMKFSTFFADFMLGGSENAIENNPNLEIFNLWD